MVNRRNLSRSVHLTNSNRSMSGLRKLFQTKDQKMYRLLTPVISKVACLLISLSKIGARENLNKLKCFIVTIACLALSSIGSAAQVMPTPGFNLGNTLESTWGYAHPTQALINSIADAGFKTLRVPCAWDFNSTNGTINAAYMTEVANVVDWALARGMYVIINDHWDNGWFERND